MSRIRWLRLFFLGVLLCQGPGLQARYRAAYDQTWLFAHADLVVVVEPIKNEKAADRFPHPERYGLKQENFEAVLTTFQVHAVFKGRDRSLKKPKEGYTEMGAIRVVHFHYAPGKGVIVNPAGFVYFGIGPATFEFRRLAPNREESLGQRGNIQPRWLAFLKRKPDGRYEPMGDAYDPDVAFLELHEPLFFGAR